MKMFSKFFLLISMTITLASCGLTHEERQERRADALDVSGTYNVSSSNGLSIEIINEGERSNVYAVVRRNSFSAAEEAAFTRQGIPLNRADHLRTSVKIGKGKDIIASMSGGENISTDGGQTSQVTIISSYSIDDVYSVTYSLQATMEKSTATFSGTLDMSISKKVVQNAEATYSTVDGCEISFSTNNGQGISNQYMGTWTGNFEAINSSVIVNALSSITFSSSTSTSTVTIKGGLNTFSYDGEVFTISNNIKNVSAFSSKYPGIYFEYVGNHGSRIQVSGTIYSLGRFTGNAVFSNGNPIGSFHHSKK